ncbi:MAG TPA: cell division protein ZapB [Patescibacteria group bacterium]|nr:cell division protein ZapB [Patescibacteria group bacterium]
MAVHFLGKLPSYVQQTVREVFRRREVVCAHLQENYKVRRNTDADVYDAILRELAAEGIEISPSSYQADKALLRTAYLWLVAESDTEKERVFNTASSSARVGINCCLKDKVRVWADLNLGSVPAVPSEPEEPAAPRVSLAELQGGAELAGRIQSMVEALETVLMENERLRTEAQRLLEENEQLRLERQDNQQFIQFVEAENTDLEERLRVAKQGIKGLHTARIQDLAEQYPEYPELYRIAQEISMGETRRKKDIETLQAKLPQTFVWTNDQGKISYERRFLDLLFDLMESERNQVIDQLATLSTQGSQYASLHTRKYNLKIPFSPNGCFVSRGADDLRFTWKKNGEIRIFWLYRKGDSRVRQTEA